MKKYNRANKKWFILGLVFPILLFFVAVNITYAYFTAVATQSSSTASPIIKISFNEDSSTIDSQPITGSTKLIPGKTLSISGKINNNGTADVYAIINFKIKITKQNGATENAVNKYYSLNGSKLKEIKGTVSNYSNYAFEILQGTNTNTFGVEYLFNFNKYNNSYQNALVEYTLSAEAIQKGAIETNVQATDILMSEHKSSINQIVGVSEQNGTPTPASPVAIKSVGDKTRNLFDINNMFLTYRNYPVDVGYSPKIENGAIYSGGVTGHAAGALITIPTEGNNTFTYSADVEADSYYVQFYVFNEYDSNKKIVSPISVASGNNLNTTVTLSSNYKYISVAIWSSVKYSVKLTNLQIEYGAEKTEYEPYGYRIPIAQQSDKNLVNVNDINNTNGYLNINGVNAAPSRDDLKITDFILIPTGVTEITISGMSMNSMSAPSTCFYDETKQFISGENFNSAHNKTFIVPTNAKYFKTCFRTMYTNFMVEYGPTATEYEPYLITKNIYLNEPLRSIGDVYDYIDLETGKVVRNIAEKIVTGSESLTTAHTSAPYNSDYSTNRILCLGSNGNGLMPLTNGTQIIAFTSHLEFYNHVWNNTTAIGFATNNVYQFHLRFTNETLGIDAADDYAIRTTKFNDYLTKQYTNGTPVVINYQRATADTSETITVPDLSWLDVGREFTIGTEVQPKLIYNY